MHAPYCKDCKHFLAGNGMHPFDYCLHEDLRDPTGRPRMAIEVRMRFGGCEKDGKYFEPNPLPPPRDAWYKRIFK